MTNLANRGNQQPTPINQMKQLLDNGGVKGMFENALQENAGAFITSLIDLYNSDNYLQQCEPKAVMMEALKAATLNLPINKSLGFAYIIPYNNSKKINGKWVKVLEPQFQLSYKGYTQLALRTGQYKHLNAGVIYEGMKVKQNYLTGNVEIIGEPISDTEIGYFCYMQLINGFEKAVYMTKEECMEHGKKFSKTFDNKANEFNAKSNWVVNPTSMCLKTVTLKLLSKYGILSTELQNVIKDDTDREIELDISENANQGVMTLGSEPEYVEIKGEVIDTETGEIVTEEEKAEDVIKTKSKEKEPSAEELGFTLDDVKDSVPF